MHTVSPIPKSLDQRYEEVAASVAAAPAIVRPHLRPLLALLAQIIVEVENLKASHGQSS